MTDPLSIVALSAAVGGVAGKFVEKAWEAGEKYLGKYYSDHGDKVREAAQRNAAEFLADLAKRVATLEASDTVPKETIATAQDHPQFAMTLHRALLSAAETDDQEKHFLLARLVADRLATKSDTLIAVASKLACEAIAGATNYQLRLLGLLATIFQIVPRQDLAPAAYSQWLERRLAPYEALNFTQLDLHHLEALSCAKFEPLFARDLGEVLSQKTPQGLDKSAFLNTRSGAVIAELWEKKGLAAVTLTSVGALIGIYVADLISGNKTDLRNFQ